MKKALQISIAKTLFTVEEDAYIKLENYLAEIKISFKDTEGCEEIIADIENRITEQLIESKEKVITIGTVEKILNVMGSIEDFGDTKTNTEKEGENRPVQRKKLYRNQDGMLIAGVCSGLGTFFNIDPVLVRLGFVVFTFLSGFGIIAYIIFWIIVPEAKTKSQQLEMAGAPVTIETLSGVVKERIEEIKTNKDWKSNLRNLINFPFKVAGKIIRFFIKIIVPVVRIFLSIFLVVSALLVFIGVTIGSGFFLSSGIWITNNIPLQNLLPGNIQIMVLIGIALAFIIPALFVLIGGFSLIKRKNFISGFLGLGLLGLWLISLTVSGFGVSQVMTNYTELKSNIEYQTVNTVIPIEEQFENLKVGDGISLILYQDTTTTLTTTDRMENANLINTKIKDNTLTIEKKEASQKHFCIFCSNEKTEVVLTVPYLTNITLEDGASLKTDSQPNSNLEMQSLNLVMTDGSYADIALTVSEFKTEISDGSELKLKGGAYISEINIEYGSTLEADKFKTVITKIKATNGSNAKIYVSKTLDATAEYGSTIIYTGSPEITKEEIGGGKIKPVNEKTAIEMETSDDYFEVNTD